MPGRVNTLPSALNIGITGPGFKPRSLKKTLAACDQDAKQGALRMWQFRGTEQRA
jgi:hypothetical protein